MFAKLFTRFFKKQVHNPFNRTGIKPCGYQILVRIPPAKKSEGMIEIPESVQAREQVAAVVAQVLELGPGCYKGKDRYPGGQWCNVGDFIAMSPYTGVRVVSPLTKEALRFIPDDTVAAVVPDPSYVERGL